MNILKEFYALNSKLLALKWIQEDIIDKYMTDYSAHIVRVTNKTVDYIQNVCIKKIKFL
jgi:hypothetical protein